MSQWEPVMQNHAKSFHLASLFFPRKIVPKVKALYALCRWLDDAVDEAPNNQQAIHALDQISQDLSSNQPLMPVNTLYHQNNLDIGYMLDLIDGVKQDLSLVRIKNRQELIQYCYKVAGTVGLAMFDLMKVYPIKARAHAVDLGIAMQITNICRDVKEDLDRDRIYIPLDLLSSNNISEQDLIQGNYSSHEISQATRQMLEVADIYYASAAMAYKNIPWRARGAIIIAANLYRAIGLKLIRKGANPMIGRTYLNPLEKSYYVAKGLIQWLFSPLGHSKLNHNNRLHSGLRAWGVKRGFSH